LPALAIDKQTNELKKKIFEFHQSTHGTLANNQAISDPKGDYFQYSRYHGILEEFGNLSFQNFLDVGCAEGMYLLAVKNRWRQCDVCGVDFSSAGLKKAKA